MNDAQFIARIAELWVELGGDADGVDWLHVKLRDAVADILDNLEDAK